MSDWKPTAIKETLCARAKMLAIVRGFFADRSILEVETPTLSLAGTTDTQIESIIAHCQFSNKNPMYLSTSPELHMKRLLAADYGDMYQISRVFRDKELGRWHQPEFTLLEWYRVGWDDMELMKEVEVFLKIVLEDHFSLAPSNYLTYQEAFLKFLGIDINAGFSSLRQQLKQKGLDFSDNLKTEELLDLTFNTVIAPKLKKNTITFIYDFPVNQAALAKIKPGEPPVAARFEALLQGIELANGFAELTDSKEQKLRFENEQKNRQRAGQHVPPIDKSFLSALSHGLPNCAGVAIGLDRLLAIALGLESISETMSFAHPTDIY